MVRKTYSELPREEIKWYPKIDYDLCASCETCLKFCPNGVFERRGDKIVVARPYDCVVGCQACASLCPNKAISFPTRKELKQMLEALRKKYGYG
ncbi:MAG: 4Fe-4S dicluster domain-containing protein [Thermoproteota archaeon]